MRFQAHGGMDPACLASEAQDVAVDLHQIAVAVLNCNCQRNKNVESVRGCWPMSVSWVALQVAIGLSVRID